jgi:hypothetical protein
MAKGIIGQPFTFTALFLDSVGAGVVLTTPTIEVFYYNASGIKTSVVPAGTVLPSTPEVGRYSYFLCPIPTSLLPSTQLYGVMAGTDPGSGDELVIEQEVDLFAQDSSTDGMRHSFIPLS